MEKQDTTTVIYHNIPIEEYKCVKEFRSQIEHIAIKLNKSDAWICKTKRAINNGLKIMFLHIWNTEEGIFAGKYRKRQMVFQTYIGFDTTDAKLYPMGEFYVRDKEALAKKYEGDTEFVFRDLEWNIPKEKIIETLIEDLKAADYR